MKNIEILAQEIRDAINAADSIQALDTIRVFAFGKKGIISEQLKSLSSMSSDMRKIAGPVLNSLKKQINGLLTERRKQLRKEIFSAEIAHAKIDVTLPVRQTPAERGRIHPISQVIDEIIAIFSDMRFTIAMGPDIETDYYNFTALNFPQRHPAREMHDTFFFNPDEKGACKLLRTHTSAAQIRTMRKQKPPIRIVIPGKTYRIDSDTTHSPMFHQVEGLVIDKTVTIANMMWVLEHFCKTFFEVPSVKMRFRPSFFPFTEPSMEVDIQCDRSKADIKFGKGKDWLEILGCGMVHPKVLRNCNLDSEEYQGFAWGMGIDRIAMLKYGMPDLRAFFDADIRWLEHYGFRPLDIPTLFDGLTS
ncbi:MAG: phenylalanyl-tRNA synthetase alpha chain [Candidatus Tokpelaia sp. JSC188]|nr:MAG: phenylalanyl-tRNA synthetase alpha chain [Candidatus Tokpelaia sp. JSC188]